MVVRSVYLILLGIIGTVAVSREGVWDVVYEATQKDKCIHFSKSLFKGSEISLSILCESEANFNLTMRWNVRQSPCANEYITVNEDIACRYLSRPQESVTDPDYYNVWKYAQGSMHFTCEKNRHLLIQPYTGEPEVGRSSEKEEQKKITQAVSASQQPDSTTKGADKVVNVKSRRRRSNDDTPANTTQATITKPNHDSLLKVWEDGYYILVLAFTDSQNSPNFKLQVTVKMSYGNSYISAEDWPLLIFYGVMGLVYVLFGILWLVMLACNWRDLLRVQFWIGGVIFLGMLEKAVFFAEYESINNKGKSVNGAIVFAELVSCLKRTFARMLVIIVSLGHGIVKPRLGQTFHKVLIVGLIFFILASIEACTRALASKADQSTSLMAASVPVAIIDAIICWWIFSSLLQTTRTLRLRRNVVKLSLYRHFTNTLIFSVLASVAYMIWSMSQHRLKDCLTDWKELWMDEAFWHLLFSVILFVIMILWRPSANNQRYAFSPLLDAAEDDIDDDQVLGEAYEGMKMRTTASQQKNGTSKFKDDQKTEDDLKWVEENIPTSLVDRVLPALDSDEEIMNTKFEVSKME